MTCIQQITVTQSIEVIGDKGTKLFFTPYNQYCYERREQKDIDDECNCPCFYYNKIVWHYVVLIEEEEFWIPEFAAVPEYKTRKEIEKDFRKLREKYELGPEQPDDWKAEFKKITGIDIEAQECVALNGMSLWLKVKGS